MSSLGYVIFFTLLKKAGAVYYSHVSGMVIINGLLWGYIVFGETLNTISVIAICTILLAIYIMNMSSTKAKTC